MRSRIAIFSGYGRGGYGGAIMANPSDHGPNGGVGAYGRRGYYVPAERAYGPVRKAGARRPVARKAYRVRKMKDTPAMKRAQAKFKKAAKKCSKRRSGSFQVCMRKALKKGKR